MGAGDQERERDWGRAEHSGQCAALGSCSGRWRRAAGRCAGSGGQLSAARPAHFGPRAPFGPARTSGAKVARRGPPEAGVGARWPGELAACAPGRVCACVWSRLRASLPMLFYALALPVRPSARPLVIAAPSWRQPDGRTHSRAGAHQLASRQIGHSPNQPHFCPPGPPTRPGRAQEAPFEQHALTMKLDKAAHSS